MNEVAMDLALLTFLNKIVGILLHIQLEISQMEEFLSEGRTT
jgi:hypothetical protein